MIEYISAKLFVGNLPFTATENDLRVHFARAGFVVAVNIIQDRETGQSRGFGYVEILCQENVYELSGEVPSRFAFGEIWAQAQVNHAIKKFRSKKFQGRRLRLKAIPRAPELLVHNGLKGNPFWSGAYRIAMP